MAQDIELQYPLGSYSVANPPSNNTLMGDLSTVQTAINEINSEVAALDTGKADASALTAHEADTSTHGVSEIADAADLAPSGSLALGIMSALNPIGTIREFNVATNPATLLGFGTWSAFGAGRVTVAIDAGQTEFDTNGETGGAKTVNLQHAHTVNSHTHAMTNSYTSSFSTGNGNYYGQGVSIANQTINTGAASPGTDNQLSATQSVLQPYIVVYRWVRTA